MSKLLDARNGKVSSDVYWTLRALRDLPELGPFQEGEPSYMAIKYDSNDTPLWIWAETEIVVDGIYSGSESLGGRPTVVENYLCELKQDYHNCESDDIPGTCSCHDDFQSYTPCDYCWMTIGLPVNPERCNHSTTWEPTEWQR